MKLLNYTTSFFALILLAIIPVWAALFYYNILNEIYDSIDDGLDNQKLLIIKKAKSDASLLQRSDFDEVDFIIRQVSPNHAIHRQDVYMDTMMYMENENENEPVRLLKTYFSQNNNYYELLVYTSMVEEDDLLKQLLYSTVWLYIGLIATILILNNVLLRKIWRPFYLLLKRLQGFRLDNPGPVTLGKTRIVEFQLLNDTVQRMLQSNIDTFNSQKQFIENASHELQTPLAISLNKLESYIENNELDEQQTKLLSSLMDNLKRMERLNQALLLLFRIENQQFAGEETINLNALTKKIIDDFSDLAAFKHIEVKLTEEEVCQVFMNPDLADIMISNLLKNALVHNNPKGFVHVVIRQDSFIIENSGSTKALDEKKIFWRFYKEQNSSSSTGLGLAIAKAIAHRYGFSISYNYHQKHVISIRISKEIKV
jgi:signal transduction histidine kinase